MLRQFIRRLHLHEYQSKELMAKYGVMTQRFRVIDNAEETMNQLAAFEADEFVIKAQVFAGGRGKGKFSSGLKGGVQLTKNATDIPGLVNKMLNHRLVTHQTTKEGVLVKKIMVAEALDIKKETYFAIVMDRSQGGPVMIGCPEGGMDIEELAIKFPEKIFKEPIDVTAGIKKDQAERMAQNLGFMGEEKAMAADQIQKLYLLFMESDATQVEINPFASTPHGQVVCFDAKINFDDNASYRQNAIFNQRDLNEEDPREVDALNHQLNYVGMDGNIGCLVNGAGLAMATMDIIKLYGGSPANFLDVGGSANENQIKEALRIITSDAQVKAILVNIFGGIMKCDTIAAGLVAATESIADWKWPLVVRLSGTNVELGKEILQKSKVPITFTDDLDDAAMKSVAFAIKQ